MGRKVTGFPRNMVPAILAIYVGFYGFGKENYMLFRAFTIGIIRVHIPTIWGLEVMRKESEKDAK